MKPTTTTTITELQKYLDILNFIPEITLLLSLFVFGVLLPVFFGDKIVFGDKKISDYALNFQRLGFCIIFSLLLSFFTLYQSTNKGVLIGDYLISDKFTNYSRIIIYILVLFWWAISKTYFAAYPEKTFEYNFLIGLSVFGLTLLPASCNLLGTFLLMELVGFILYTLAASRSDSPYVVEAATKYFFQGNFMSAIYIFGVAMVYSMTGTLSYYGLNNFFNRTPLASFEYTTDKIYMFTAMLFILSLFFFKIAIVPYHFWVADTYEGVTLPVTAFFAIVVKFTMTMALVRFMGLFFTTVFKPYFSMIFILLIALSVFFGTIAACAESRIKRVFAYSSIAHSGHLLAGLLCTNMASVISYALVYAVANILIFAYLMSLAVDEKTPGSQVIHISDLNIVSDKDYLYTTFFGGALFTLAGLPPFGGFVVKFRIIMGVWSDNHKFLAVFMLLLGVVAAFYYIRFIKCLWFSQDAKKIQLTTKDDLNKLICMITYIFLGGYGAFEILLNPIFYQMSACVSLKYGFSL